MAEFLRHYERMQHMRGRLFVIQFSGAVGTLASLGNAGRDVQAEFARELGLGQPLIAWHSARDTIAEFVTVVSMIGASCAKAANEVIQLQRNEIAEIAEPSGSDSVGSSTMPQKQNPMMCEAVVAVGRIVRQDAALILDCMVQQHERDMSAWQAEWECVPEAAIMVSGALEQTRRVYQELAVDPERMMSNLAITGGQITAEAVMMSLAPLIGRQRAHHAVADAARQSSEHRLPFAACLSEQPDVAMHLGRGDIERLLMPEAYLGQSVDAVDRVLAAFGRI
jgi:3-carboxy-cis,cis-muconate cycloisomerase